jgi:hypothetical protein
MRQIACGVLSIVVVGSIGCGGSEGVSAEEPLHAKPRNAALPVAPDATHFMWQGAQTAFLDAGGQPCTGHVAIAVSNEATCYRAAHGALRCAGRIGPHVYGPTFTEVGGVEDVEQIILTETTNELGHNWVCVTSSGQALCMGNNNDWGQLGTGDTSPQASFVPFGDLDDVTAIAASYSQVCVVTRAGEASCAGYSFGASPASVGSGVESLWIDPTGEVQINDPTVFRVANEFNASWITSGGAYFDAPPMPTQLGTPGDVVDLAMSATASLLFPGISRYCWLNGEGEVWCQGTDTTSLPPMPDTPLTPPAQIFTARKVLAFAGDFYGPSICAIYDDGSIACMGDNREGQLGVAGSSSLDAETIVAPPGSADVKCR